MAPGTGSPSPEAAATDLEAPKKPLACLPCSKAKTKCDYSVPCERCFRNNLTCVQQLWRPPKKPQKRAKRAPSAASASSSTAGAEEEGYYEKAAAERPKAESGRRVREPPLVDDRPIVELALSRTDPGVAAGIFVRAFHKVYAEGQIVRPSVLALMRVWRTWSLATGSDVTWGVLGKLAEALQVTAAELEGPELLAYGMSAEEGRRRAQEAMKGMHRRPSEMPPELGLPRADVDPQKAMVMALMPDFSREHEWDRRAFFEELTTSGSYGSGSGMFPIFQQCCNAEYAGMVKAIGDLQGDVVRYRAIQMLLLVALVAPDDREHFFQDFQRLFFTEASCVTTLVKASYGDGQVRLYLYSGRRVRLGNGRVALVHNVEVCPKSSHVIDRPDATFAVVRKFRRFDDDSTSASTTTTRATEPPSTTEPAAATAWGAGAPLPSHYFPALGAWPLAPGAADPVRAALEGERMLKRLLLSSSSSSTNTTAPAPALAASGASSSSLSSSASGTSGNSGTSESLASHAEASSAAPAPAQNSPLPLFHDLLVPRGKRVEIIVERPPDLPRHEPPARPPPPPAPAVPVAAVGKGGGGKGGGSGGSISRSGSTTSGSSSGGGSSSSSSKGRRRAAAAAAAPPQPSSQQPQQPQKEPAAGAWDIMMPLAYNSAAVVSVPLQPPPAISSAMPMHPHLMAAAAGGPTVTPQGRWQQQFPPSFIAQQLQQEPFPFLPQPPPQPHQQPHHQPPPAVDGPMSPTAAAAAVAPAPAGCNEEGLLDFFEAVEDGDLEELLEFLDDAGDGPALMG